MAPAWMTDIIVASITYPHDLRPHCAPVSPSLPSSCSPSPQPRRHAPSPLKSGTSASRPLQGSAAQACGAIPTLGRVERSPSGSARAHGSRKFVLATIGPSAAAMAKPIPTIAVAVSRKSGAITKANAGRTRSISRRRADVSGVHRTHSKESFLKSICRALRQQFCSLIVLMSIYV